MGPLDGMVMAGKGTPSEESVPLACPKCRGEVPKPPDIGRKVYEDRTRVYCRACRIYGSVADWHLIEQLRIYIGRAVCSMEVY